MEKKKGILFFYISFCASSQTFKDKRINLTCVPGVKRNHKKKGRQRKYCVCVCALYSVCACVCVCVGSSSSYVTFFSFIHSQFSRRRLPLAISLSLSPTRSFLQENAASHLHLGTPNLGVISSEKKAPGSGGRESSSPTRRSVYTRLFTCIILQLVTTCLTSL